MRCPGWVALILCHKVGYGQWDTVGAPVGQVGTYKLRKTSEIHMNP